MNKKNIISGTGLLLAAILFVCFIIVVNATFTNLRLDLTENKLFTLSDGTVNIINSLEEPVVLDYYFSQQLLTGLPSLSNYGVRVRDMLQEFEAVSDGNLIVNVIDAEPFSEAEDQAVASGLRGIPVNNAGDRAYLGLVGTNSTDDERVIPFFQADRESSLEYDVTKLIYNLAHPKKPVIGIMTSLPMFGDEDDPNIGPWTIISTLNEFFEMKQLDTDLDEVNKDIDVLMIVHPKKLKLRTRFAIDQYILNGGKAMIFVDPLAESDRTPPDPKSPGTMPDFDSELPDLLKQWGVEIPGEKVAGDINAAMHVQTRSQRGLREVAYLPWLRLAKESFNKDDFATSELSVLHMGTSGVIDRLEDATTQITPLIETTKQSMLLDRDFLVIQRDPSIILDNFISDEEKKSLAVRIQGRAKTAFPDGISGDKDYDEEQDGPDTGKGDQLMKGDINLIVVADTDILTDLFWIRTQSYFGLDMPQPIADNGNFIVNSIDNLSGSNDLISLRSRGEFVRPFERVEVIRRDAELKFREREQELQAKLQEAEQKLQRLQQEQGTDVNLILTPEQSAELEQLREIRLETRKDLRAVQHELKKNIEDLGTRLRIINIGLIPVLVTLIALGTGIYRTNRRQ